MDEFKVNDIHVHLGRSERIYQSFEINEITPFMKKFNIQEIALMPFEIETEIYNKKIIELSKKNRNIHGLYWIKKSRIKEDLAILKDELNQGLIGVKFHSAFENSPVTNEDYAPIIEFLNENNSIILVHCGRYKDGNKESNSSYLHGIDLAKKYTKLKVILAHMGGNDSSIVKKAVNDSKEIKNIFFDTSGISTPFRIEYAVKKIGPERVLFGSDYPWCSFRGNYYNALDSILNKEEKQKIFHDNFLNMIRK